MVAGGNPVRKDLEREIRALREQALQRLDPTELAGIVEAVLSSMAGDLTATDVRLYGEIEALSKFIQNARTEIAAVRPDQIRNKDIPLATDELDAVVDATEAATNAIMDACDRIGNLGGDLAPEVSDRLQEEVTKIYEACNFQDITGQRITKVVRTLKTIEDRVSAMLTAFGEELARIANEDPPPAAVPAVITSTPDGKIDDKSLLNGPQMPDEAKRQAEIDAIMASFG